MGSSEAQNHFLYLGLDRAFLLNLARMAALLYFRLDILASIRHCENDKYCSWNIMCRPVLRHLSSILLSAFVIIQPQYAAPNSQIGTICCFNTSTNSGMGQPKVFSLSHSLVGLLANILSVGISFQIRPHYITHYFILLDNVQIFARLSQ